MWAADEIASMCYTHYSTKLPKKGQPDPRQEWTLLAAVVKVEEKGSVQSVCSSESKDVFLEVVAMGTGSKCIGQTKMSKGGDVVNDSHAEVTARRGFLRYLYYELREAFRNKNSIFVASRQNAKWKLKAGITFVFFISHTPCGDASIIPMTDNSIESYMKMETMWNDEQDVITLQDKNIELLNLEEHLQGKRPKWDGRCHHIIALPKKFRVQDLKIQQSQLEFVHSRHSALSSHDPSRGRLVPCAAAISWSAVPDHPLDVSVNGYRQGATKKILGTPQARSRICKAELFMLFRELLNSLSEQNYPVSLRNIKLKTYWEFKEAATDYQKAWNEVQKQAFVTWIRSPRDYLQFH
ncbi:tRNA-specific adenosine deaminase 1 isoform X3 [Narcine bancroftii]|uniref:tRNA-specific adenosine deaminase 1 isoform X3 n=1 Tax=Narcine bancroftii TaxID=1343680 RepID=UPI0038312C4D